MSKPENVVDHWHYFPQGMEDIDSSRVDICRLSPKGLGIPKFAVWIIETDVSIPFHTFNDALSFVKNFMLGRYMKPAVNENGEVVP